MHFHLREIIFKNSKTGHLYSTPVPNTYSAYRNFKNKSQRRHPRSRGLNSFRASMTLIDAGTAEIDSLGTKLTINADGQTDGFSAL